MEKELKEFIAEIREFIKHNSDEMSYYDDPATPYEIIRIDELEDFLLEKEHGNKQRKRRS